MQDAAHRGGIGRHYAAVLGLALGALLVAWILALAVPAAAGPVAKTRRVSVSSSGAEANGDSFHSSISANGRFVAFDSEATNLVGNDTGGNNDVFVRDLKTHKTRRVSVSSLGAEAEGDSERASISADGRFVAFTSEAANLVGNDTNGNPDVF